MATKFIDSSGLSHLISKIKSAIPTKVSQLNNDSGYTTNTGTVTKVTAGTGLTGGDITTSGTVAIKTLQGTISEDACIIEPIEANRVYAVGVDNSGYLAVHVPWENDKNTDTKVKQTSINTNANYPILLKKSNSATTETNEVNATNLTSGTAISINPSTGNINAVKLNDVSIGSTPKFTDTVTTVSTTGSGNAVTAISDNGSGVLTATKGSTFLTSHQTIKQDGITGATVNRFGTCSTGASTAAKTVSITTGTFSLEKGARVTVEFSNANTAGTPTLNVNSTGAKNIYHKGSQITTGDNKALLAGTVDFVYTGSVWQLVGNYIDTNTSAVTGVKGNSESSYRTGNVNLTAANIGAAAASHSHSGTIVPNVSVTGASYTPAGSISTGTGTTNYTPAGTIGTGTGTSNYTPAGSVSQPTFTGTQATISSSGSTSGVAVTKHTYTPAGSISVGTGTANYTPAGTVSQPSFTGTQATISSSGSTSGVAVAKHTYTPAGSISVGTGTANYTPAGSVSTPTITVTPSTGTVNSITAVGTLPTATISNNTLVFTAGTLPTKGSNTTVVTGISSATSTQPTFTGTGAQLKFTGTSADLTHSVTQGTVSASATYTPAGSVSQPTFTGTGAQLKFTGTSADLTHSVTQGTVSASATYTPAGTVSQPSFTGTGTQLTFTGTGTQLKFTGTAATITPTVTGASTDVSVS